MYMITMIKMLNWEFMYLYSNFIVTVIPAPVHYYATIFFFFDGIISIHLAPSGFMIRSTAGGIPSVVQFLYTIELFHSPNCCFIEFLNALLTLKSIGCNFPVHLAGMLPLAARKNHQLFVF